MESNLPTGITFYCTHWVPMGHWAHCNVVLDVFLRPRSCGYHLGKTEGSTEDSCSLMLQIVLGPQHIELKSKLRNKGCDLLIHQAGHRCIQAPV